MTISAELNSQGVPLRLEARQSIVHVVEYSRYPRRLASENIRVGYTQDRSETGLGLDLPERVSPGELLQVTVRDIDGQASVNGLARVVWCKEMDGGRARAGISMLRENGQRPMMRVRSRGKIASNNHVLGSQ
jgi:hypothetical protein